MKKTFLFGLLLFCFCQRAKADHITGGEMFYTLTSSANGSFTYNVTFKLFMRCFSNRRFNDPTIVSIFDKVTGARITDMAVGLTSSETIRLNEQDPCITNPPEVCYVVGYYNFNVTLPASKNGYVLASQVNFRIASINNLFNGYSNVGANYTAEIPGNGEVAGAVRNNSAKFIGSDLVVVCADNRFSYSFAATDADGDGLRYYFCDAYQSGDGANVVSPTPPPPFNIVPYGNSFSGSKPLGDKVEINPTSGLITGIAPSIGVYVVTVCVEEIRNGKVIAVQRKDLQINIAPCDVAAALLQPDYMLCKETKSATITNLSTSSLIKTYSWEVADRSGSALYGTTEKILNYTFVDTGTYTVKLAINKGEACTDSVASIIRVYPGFKPDFNYSGICFKKPTLFTDISTTTYGRVNSWSWNFGSTVQNPTYTYANMGQQSAQLIATNSVGCRDTAFKTITLVEKPPINLPFKDTLICAGDPLTLNASGDGVFTWSIPPDTVSIRGATPTVSPSVNTVYKVNIDMNGCLNSDSVLVRVTNQVNLKVMNDTTICQGDTIQLRVVSDGFTYAWTPANQLSNAHIANPLAVTTNTTLYAVTANIGSCAASGNVNVTTVAYPTAFAGNDTTICYNTTGMLSGLSNGFQHRWTPSIGLSSTTTLNPTAKPRTTTNYVLTAYDTKGCPKPSTDTVTVTVLPPIVPFAGRDTSVVINQPLQLEATGGSTYLWSPSYGLSSTTIANPIALYNELNHEIQYKVLVFNIAGCADSAFVKVKMFATGPSIFVPTAFTPNGDNKNDLLRPIAAGIKNIEFFNVYNRWGQLVFSTRINGRGWDGTVNGQPQATGVFVWQVKAIDYNNIPYFRRGTVTLIK